MQLKNADRLTDDDIVVNPLVHTRIRSVDGDQPFLIFSVDYLADRDDALANKTSTINFTIEADAASQLGAALTDAAKKRLAEPHVTH